MKRYRAKMSAFVESIIMPWFAPEGEYVLASDVADLERRYREVVGLLRDLWIVLDERAKTDAPSGVYLHLKAFLAGEEEET